MKNSWMIKLKKTLIYYRKKKLGGLPGFFGVKMIRKFKKTDSDEIMQIWLDCNINAHDFVAKEYWQKNYPFVRDAIQYAEVYIYEIDQKIVAFIGLQNDYIAGIFVKKDFQGQGIGQQLLNYAKDRHTELTLSVYEKNKNAVNFYVKHGFSIEKSSVDTDNGEVDYLMKWKRKNADRQIFSQYECWLTKRSTPIN
jgi:ribosomal protein S18 acetylase RimI-like enzyme